MMPNTDTQLFFMFNALTGHSVFLDSLIVFCGDYLAYIVVALFVAFLSVTKYPWRQKLEVLLVALGSVVLARGVITELIRQFYHRPRPFIEFHLPQAHTLITDSSWSFPSGHATFFFGLATTVYLYDRRWGAWFLVAAVLITLGRVAAGVHYPSDIAAGAVIGIGTAYVSYLGVRRFWNRTTD